MEPFHHVLWMSVLVFLVLETAAVLQWVKVDFPVQTDPEWIEVWKGKTGGETSWLMEMDVLNSDEEFESRHSKYPGKVLAINVKYSELETSKMVAAAKFAKENIRNGVFLTVSEKGFSKKLVQKYQLNWIGVMIESDSGSNLIWDPDPKKRFMQNYWDKKSGGKYHWWIHSASLNTEEAYVNRYETYKDKVIAICLSQNPTEIAKHEGIAVAEFAGNNVNNGIFLTVPKQLSKQLKTKYKINWGNFLIDLKDKIQKVIVTDKAEYEKRYTTYEGKDIYTYFHKYDVPAKKDELEFHLRTQMDWIVEQVKRKYIWVVLLVVHVDVVGDDFIYKLCPLKKKPHHIPRAYHERDEKVIRVIAPYEQVAEYIVSCQKKKLLQVITEDGTDTPEEDGTNTPEEDGTDTPEEDGTDTPEEDGTDTPEEDGPNA
ncbi:uncharacterized protein LOC128993932 isoform X2 [Macrosteles quadrilineatus]|uniref:uncharacterized protein LOC128993932 isoform X2 n=1 Tax=Macrosteles quadrilineatus TaxID=74068 RepID=UPI0023E121FE|nr:uncharacterized protein LOC128993932 isoform X2 [Macrosteles quadrilineatus]